MSKPPLSQTDPDPPGTPSPPARPAVHPVREFLKTATMALIFYLLIRSVVVNFQVDGESMLPTFQDGEMIFVNRAANGSLDLGDIVDWIPGIEEQHWVTIIEFGGPERGDVVVLIPPPPGLEKPYIKRVIGLPGDHVQITENRVYINGTPLNESYIGNYAVPCAGVFRYCDLTVPEGSVFVMGDHRDESQDSRYFGPVSEDRIIGRAWMIYWPSDVWGPVHHPGYPELSPSPTP